MPTEVTCFQVVGSRIPTNLNISFCSSLKKSTNPTHQSFIKPGKLPKPQPQVLQWTNQNQLSVNLWSSAAVQRQRTHLAPDPSQWINQTLQADDSGGPLRNHHNLLGAARSIRQLVTLLNCWKIHPNVTTLRPLEPPTNCQSLERWLVDIPWSDFASIVNRWVVYL